MSRTWPLSVNLPLVRNKNWILLFKSRDEWIFCYDISIRPFVDRSVASKFQVWLGFICMSLVKQSCEMVC